MNVDSLVRVSLLLAFALFAMPLLKGRSAVARRLVLTVVFAFVLVVPFVPAWQVQVPAYQELVGRVVSEPSIAAVAAAPALAASPLATRSVDLLAIAWACGAFAVAARFVIGLVIARRIVGRSQPAPDAWNAVIADVERTTGRRAVVRVSREVEAPAVTGLFAPIVLVPDASWSAVRMRSVLLHEVAHVAAHDLGVQVLVTIVSALYWFHPLAWLAARRLRLERELAADEAVLRSGVRASTYAADLLAIAGAAPMGTIAIGAKPLPKRIKAIVAARRPTSVGPLGACGLVLGTATVALGVACTTNVEPPRPSVPVVVSEPTALAAPTNDLQLTAEHELGRAMTEWKSPGGTVLVLSPKGEVLADAGGRSDRTFVAGSTMKALLLAAAIDEGVVNERDVFESTAGVRAPLPDLIATSSNLGFSQVFDRLGSPRLDRTLHRFHFATPSELGASAAIGATLTATPRQVALAYAALADGGADIVKPETAARVTTLLEGVVTSEHGTGKQARVTGARVAGKTGTSEWTAPDGTKKTYASFVGYVPADKPRFVIFVGVESPVGEGPWGGAVAAPVFARIAAHALAR